MGRKSKEMSPEIKRQVLRLHEEGYSKAEIGRITGYNRSTISKFLKNFDDSGSLENRRRSGRPKSTSVYGDRILIRLVKEDRRRCFRDLMNEFNQSIPRPVGRRTIQRRLSSFGYHRRVVAKTLTISSTNRKKRVDWCRNRLHWTVLGQWTKIIFSDEMQVVLGKNSRVYVWRKSEERWNINCLGLYGERNGGARVSAMFWGCISHKGVGTIVDIEGNINSNKYINILDQNLWPVIAKCFDTDQWIFQDDNAPVHQSIQTISWKNENRINCLQWPSQSPDLNIIENIWRYIKIRLQQEQHTIKSRADLVSAVTKIWQAISSQYISNLYRSIPRRLRHVIKAKGHATKY